MPANEELSTNRRLLAAVKNPHDESAWAEFFSLYEPLIRRWCLRSGLQKADADDTVQQVLICLFEKMRRFCYDSGKGRFRDWLQVVTRRAAIDTLRRLSRQLDVAAGNIVDVMAEVPQHIQESVTMTRRRALQEAEGRVQHRVTQRSWRVYVCRKRHGISGADIATDLGMTREAVYVTAGRVWHLVCQEARKVLLSM